LIKISLVLGLTLSQDHFGAILKLASKESCIRDGVL
jgi:hypothetical protein